MKFTVAISLLAGLVAAAPASNLDERQLGITRRNDLKDGNAGACPSAVLIFARGTGESGNMGASVGPALTSGLDRQVRDLWVQGVGEVYGADVAGNLARRGSAEDSIKEAVDLMKLARTKCPESKIVAAGYSQGAALIAAAVSDMPAADMEFIAGVDLFGYTKNQQNRGGIPNFPAEKTKVFCNPGDLVCSGTLTLLAPHFLYTSSARGDGADFLAQRINA
jgi:cutinase